MNFEYSEPNQMLNKYEEVGINEEDKCSDPLTVEKLFEGDSES